MSSPDVIVLGPHDNLGLRKQAFRMKAMRMASTRPRALEMAKYGEDEEGEQSEEYLEELLNETETTATDPVSSADSQEGTGAGSSSLNKGPRKATKPQSGKAKQKTVDGIKVPPPPPPPDGTPSPSPRKITKIRKTGSPSSGEQKKVVESSPKPNTTTATKKTIKCPTVPKKDIGDTTSKNSDSSEKRSVPSASPRPTQTPANPKTPPRAPRKRIIILKEDAPSPTRKTPSRTHSDDPAESSANNNGQSRPRRSLPGRTRSLEGDNKPMKKSSSPAASKHDDAVADASKPKKLIKEEKSASKKLFNKQDKPSSRKLLDKEDKATSSKKDVVAAADEKPTAGPFKEEKKGIFRAMRSKIFSRGI